MSPRILKTSDQHDSLPKFPLGQEHWKAVVDALELAPQEAATAKLILQGLCDKQIAKAMGIGEPTVRTYLSRISAKTKTRGRMELALRVLEVSHKVIPLRKRHRKR